MWLVTALPLVLGLTCLANLYLLKEEIFIKSTFNEKLKAFVPRDIKLIVYLVLALLCGLSAFYATDMYFHSTLKSVKLSVLMMLLFSAAFIDFKERRIPNTLILIGFFLRVIIYIFEAANNSSTLLATAYSDFIGLLFGGGLFFVCALISKNSIGMGDVKLYAMIGIFSGLTGTFGCVFFSLVVCFIVSIFLLVTGKKGRKDTLPFAPFVLLGTFITILLGSI